MPAPTCCLLDVNLLIALAWPNHVHHAQAHRWFDRQGRRSWATCPLTELAFIRISSNRRIIEHAVDPRAARSLLREMTALPGHVFWPDDSSPLSAGIFDSLALIGHRQVTDAYLLALAEQHEASVATFDRGLGDLIADPKRRAALVELLV